MASGLIRRDLPLGLSAALVGATEGVGAGAGIMIGSPKPAGSLGGSGGYM